MSVPVLARAIPARAPRDTLIRDTAATTNSRRRNDRRFETGGQERGRESGERPAIGPDPTSDRLPYVKSTFVAAYGPVTLSSFANSVGPEMATSETIPMPGPYTFWS